MTSKRKILEKARLVYNNLKLRFGHESDTVTAAAQISKDEFNIISEYIKTLERDRNILQETINDLEYKLSTEYTRLLNLSKASSHSLLAKHISGNNSFL